MNNSEFLILILIFSALGFGSCDMVKDYVLRRYRDDNTMQPEKIKVRVTVFAITYIVFILGASYTISLICR